MVLPNPFPSGQTEHMAAYHNGQPDNTRVLMREAVKATQGGSGLGDYQSELHHRVLETKGGAGQQGGRGPLSYPVIPKPGDDTDLLAILREIRDLLKRMPQALSLEFRTRFIVPPRESISFIAPSPATNIGVGAAVAVVTQVIPERFTGYLTHVGVSTNPVGAAANITWQIRVNGSIHPEFSNRVFAGNNLATPIPFNMELTQARTVQLVAINTGGAILSCAGVLAGWTEFMSDYKPYGSSPATGIA